VAAPPPVPPGGAFRRRLPDPHLLRFRRATPSSELRAVVDYVAAHRDGAPFDVAVEGVTAAGADETARIGAYVEAGLTWWVEALGWWHGDVPGARARIDAGPTRKQLAP
jgi:hypothetical protein